MQIGRECEPGKVTRMNDAMHSVAASRNPQVRRIFMHARHDNLASFIHCISSLYVGILDERCSTRPLSTRANVIQFNVIVRRPNETGRMYLPQHWRNVRPQNNLHDSHTQRMDIIWLMESISIFRRAFVFSCQMSFVANWHSIWFKPPR